MTTTEEITFEFCFDESLIACGEHLLLAITHIDTNLCQGTVIIKKVMTLDKENDVFTLDKLMRIKRKRGFAKAMVKKKSFVCSDCEYSASEEYFFARHVARTHDKSLEPQDCIFL